LIAPADGASLLAAIGHYNPEVVELSGPGGDFMSATQIGVAIRSRGIATHATGDCFSSCAFIWMAGRPMIVDEGVTIAVHLPAADEGVPYAGPAWLPHAVLGWYLGRLDLSAQMMEAFYIEATAYGRVENRHFDLVQFAQHWTAGVEVVPRAKVEAGLAVAR
jgi:hypothetical protein